jgi:uncharacterized protein (TIGR02271 family)
VFSPFFYGGTLKLPDEQNSTHDKHEEITLELHKEEFQVSKKIIETAKVNVYKKTYTVEKQILVPVTHEELIIEKKILNPESTTDAKVETIRIPLSEERIEVTKHPIIFEDVEIYKKKIEEHIQFNETLKEEKIHIDTVGDIRVMVNNQTSTL